MCVLLVLTAAVSFCMFGAHAHPKTNLPKPQTLNKPARLDYRRFKSQDNLFGLLWQTYLFLVFRLSYSPQSHNPLQDSILFEETPHPQDSVLVTHDL